MTMPTGLSDLSGSEGNPKTSAKLKFLLHGNGRWGNGETFEEAISNCPGGIRGCMVWMWTGPELPHSAWAGPFGLNWEGTTERPILIQDNRPAKEKKAMPLVIGDIA